MTPAPRTLALFVTGTLFTALLLAAPLAHLALRPSGRDILLLLVPLIVLLITLVRPHPALLYGLFPMSHLPLIALRPDIASPMVYRAAWPLLAVLVAGGAWIVAASRRLTPPRLPDAAPRDLPLVTISALLALAPLIAIAWPALRRDVEPQAAALAAVLAPLASWYCVARLVPRLVLPPALSASGRDEALAALAHRPAPRRRAFLLAATLAALALVIAALWYTFGPPPPTR